MQLSTRSQRLGVAQWAVGLWMLVAALVACVTSPGPKDTTREDLAAASLPVIGIVGLYLSVTAIFHLGIAARLRQGLPLTPGRILLLAVDHVAVLLVIGKISLSNPASPVYLSGIEVLLGVLSVSIVLSLTTGLLLWFWLPQAFSRPALKPDTATTLSREENTAGATGTKSWVAIAWSFLPGIHVMLTFGLFYALWRLDSQPLLLVR